MTRARALKKVIRARIARTGERYTTARRHVLKQLPAALKLVSRTEPSTTPAAPPAVVPIATTAKGGLSDAKSREKTGRGLDHWFAVLDTFDGVGKGHTAAARFLHETHGIDGWYAQGITVAFERARGVRAVNQRCDGDYEVSVSKVIAASTPDIVKAFADPRARKGWKAGVDDRLMTSVSSALAGKESRKFTVKPNGQAHVRFKWDETSVLVQLWPKPNGRVSVTVTNGKLADAAMVEERRAKWRTALGAVATYLSA